MALMRNACAFLSPSKWNTRIKKINSFLWLAETMAYFVPSSKLHNIIHHLIHLDYKLFSSVFHLCAHFTCSAVEQRWANLWRSQRMLLVVFLLLLLLLLLCCCCEMLFGIRRLMWCSLFEPYEKVIVFEMQTSRFRMWRMLKKNPISK